MKIKAPAKPHIRWMIRRDMPEVLAIEEARFEFPWSEEDFVRCLRQRNAIGMVAELHEKVVGFMVYELHPRRIHILNLAVRQKGIGTGRHLIEKLVSKLNPQRRNKIMLEVRESNIDAQCWLRALGFKAISILWDFYEVSPEDAYLFQYTYRGEST